MDLLAAWLLYPAVLGLLCLGLGLLVERVADWRMPGMLLLPVGFASLVTASRLITSESGLAQAALPIIAALALAGLVLGRRRLRALRPDPLLTVAVLGVFVVFAAPVAFSGEPTFAGYLALPDTSHNLSLAQMYAEFGPDWTRLPPGANQTSMQQLVASSYPVGGQAALGVTAPLGVLDLAWLYQPLLSFGAAMTALALAGIAAPVARRRWQLALVTFVAAQPALLLSFAMQGSIKEVLTVPMLVTAAALIAAAARERRPARSLMPIAIAAAAGFCTLGPAVGPYLAALFAGLAALWIPGRWPQRTRADLWWIGAGLAGVALLSLPVLRNLDSALAANTATLDSSEDLGNLAAPLKVWQVFGPWLSGDFRYTPDTGRGANVVVVAIAGLAVLGGLVWLVRTRRWSVLLLPGALIVASLYLLQRGGPYADGKVLMLASPALALTGMLGAVALFRGRLRPVSLVLCAALAGAAVYSSALIYHDVSNAPHDRYEELLDLNEQLDGQGPAIFTEYDEFGKYFLRDVPSYNQPEWPHEYREEPYDPNALVDERRRPSLKTPLDADDLQLPYVQSVRWLIVRRSPYRSRPPANFVREQVGRYYELWRRTNRYRVLAHRPLGRDFLTPSAFVSARAARAAGAAAARSGAQIAYAPRARLVITRPSIAPFSRNWSVFGNYPGAVVTRGAGRLEEAFVGIPQAGRYRVWAEGSFNREIAFDVNGVKIGRTYDGLNNPGANELLGTVRLQRAVYRLHALQPGGDLTPGTGGYRSSLRHLGPVAWQPEADERLPVRTLPASQWRRLIGKRSDWVEVVAR